MGKAMMRYRAGLLATLLMTLSAHAGTTDGCTYETGSGPTLKIVAKKNSTANEIIVDAGLGPEKCDLKEEHEPTDLSFGSGWLPATEGKCINKLNGATTLKGEFSYVMGGPESKDVIAVYFAGNVFYRGKSCGKPNE